MACFEAQGGFGNQTLAKVAASKGEGGLLSGAKCLTLTSHPQLMV